MFIVFLLSQTFMFFGFSTDTSWKKYVLDSSTCGAVKWFRSSQTQHPLTEAPTAAAQRGVSLARVWWKGVTFFECQSSKQRTGKVSELFDKFEVCCVLGMLCLYFFSFSAILRVEDKGKNVESHFSFNWTPLQPMESNNLRRYSTLRLAKLQPSAKLKTWDTRMDPQSFLATWWPAEFGFQLMLF